MNQGLLEDQEKRDLQEDLVCGDLKGKKDRVGCRDLRDQWVCKVYLVLLDLKVNKEIPVQKVHPAHQGLLARVELQVAKEEKDFRVLVALKALKVERENLELLGYQVQVVRTVTEVNVVPQVQKVKKENQVQLDHQVFVDQLEARVQRVRLVLPDFLVQSENLEHQEEKGNPVSNKSKKLSYASESIRLISLHAYMILRKGWRGR